MLLLLGGACTRDYVESEPIQTKGGFVLKLDSRGPMSATSGEELISDMRVMAFSKGGSVPFSHEVPVLTRTGNTLRSNMRTGDWELVLASAQGAALTSPTIAQPMAEQKMYEYIPSKDADGYLDHAGAAELFTRRMDNIETIVADGIHTASTALSRNVAMVKVSFDKTPGIDLVGVHTVELGNVPSTISWAGGLLPNKDNPAVLAPLKRKLKFTPDTAEPSLSASDEVVFIIPAHRGRDFWSADGLSVHSNPTDTTTRKLTISVRLKLSSGTEFVSTKEIPVVARCNGILHAQLKINKTDVDIHTSVKPWDTETVDGDLQMPYLNVERIEAEVFGKFPTRLHFWTNQPLHSIYVAREGAEVTGGSYTPIADINSVFTELAGVDATNLGCIPSAAGGLEGYFDLSLVGGDPVGVQIYKIYLKAGAIKREFTITVYELKSTSDDAPLMVDKNGLSMDNKGVFTFTFKNPGRANFKLGLFSGSTLLTQSDYNHELTNQLDFTQAAVTNEALLPRLLEVKLFVGGRWYPVKDIQQNATLVKF